ncbi:MAG: DNA polymerase III subunit epsilon [Rickettsiales bacterium]|nr:DNA polymerase III subunit epsilon [Rickettsiales bacterium]
MNRKICFDTETTGLCLEQGDRLFEIGCVELKDDVRAGRTFQRYLNPGKPLSQESAEISGISDDFLKDKPKFADIAEEFLEFIGDAVLIAHNASFDIKFINAELHILGKEPLKNEVVDTLQIARRMFPGQKASLDALCKKFFIDNSKRVFHGALLDADLLVDVYARLLKEKQEGFIRGDISIEDLQEANEKNFLKLLELRKNKTPLPPRNIKIDDAELDAHNDFILNKIKGAIWLKIGEK